MQSIATQLVRKKGQVGLDCKQLPSNFVLLLLPAFACRQWLLARCVEHGHPVRLPDSDYVMFVVDHLGDDDYEINDYDDDADDDDYEVEDDADDGDGKVSRG